MSKGLEALIDLSQQHKISLTEEHRIECYKVIEKELKALEIIKNVDFEGVLSIHKVATKNGYEERYYCLCKRLSKEEYDLLKEVLIDEPR